MSFLLDFSSTFFEDLNCDDSADKVNRQVLTGLMVFLTAFLGLKQFVGDPIQCFTPQYFSGGQELYVDGYCWTASTYQIVDTEYDPLRPHEAIQAVLNAGDGHDVEKQTIQDEVKGKKTMVSYYQWVPLFVVTQAVLCYLPYIFWKSVWGDAGVDIGNITKTAALLGECEGDPHHRNHTLKNTVKLFDTYIKVTKPIKGEKAEAVCCFLPSSLARRVGLTSSSYYCVMYIVYKLLILAELCFQIFVMHEFLDTGLLLHAFNIFYSIVLNQKWHSSERFPINTICEYRGQPQVHGYLITYNSHCVLPINLYNDKLYAGTSLAFLITTLYCAYSTYKWIKLLAITDNRNEVVEKHLRLNNVDEAFKDDFSHYLTIFLRNELKADGTFLLNMIDDNCGSCVTDQLVMGLWDSFVAREIPADKSCELLTFRQTMHYEEGELRLRVEPSCKVHGTSLERHTHHFDRASNQGSDDVKAMYPIINNNDLDRVPLKQQTGV